MPRRRFILKRFAGVGSAFSSLSDPIFRVWFISQVFAASGWMTQIAGLSWMVLDLHGGPLELSLIGVAGLVPLLLFAPWGGSLADRFDRRNLLIATQILSFVLAGVTAVLAWLDLLPLWALFAFAFTIGVVGAVDLPVRQVFVMDMVGPGRLASAISLHEVVINLSRVLGPAVGGVLLALGGPAACFAFNAIAYLAPLIVLLAHFRRLDRPPAVTAGEATGRATDGIRAAFRHPAIRACLLIALPSTVVFHAGLLYPLQATDLLNSGAEGYAVLIGAFGIGALPGALVAAAYGTRATGHVIAILGAVAGVLFAVAGLITSFGASVIFVAAVGFASIWFVTSANTFVQLNAPPNVRGAVMGTWSMVVPGAGVLTYPIVGIVTELWGVTAGFVLVGTAMALIALGSVPSMRRAISVETAVPPAACPPQM